MIQEQQPNRNPIFIGGAGRSGTTLLRVMLNAHPQLCSGPEFKFNTLVANLYNTLKNHTDITKAYHLTEGKLNSIFSQFISEFFEDFRVQNDALRVVEKTPHNVLIMKELGRIFPDSKFIHVLRDGRDVASSLLKMNWVDPNGQPLWYVQNLENASNYWSQVVAQGIKDSQDPILENRVKFIKYEDLVRAPEVVLREVIEFVGMDWSERVLEYDSVDRGFEPDESSTSQVSQKLYNHSMGKWRSSFTKEDKKRFKENHGNLLVQLGFEKNHDW